MLLLDKALCERAIRDGVTIKMLHNSADAAFVSEEVRKELHEKIDAMR